MDSGCHWLCRLAVRPRQIATTTTNLGCPATQWTITDRVPELSAFQISVARDIISVPISTSPLRLITQTADFGRYFGPTILRRIAQVFVLKQRVAAYDPGKHFNSPSPPSKVVICPGSSGCSSNSGPCFNRKAQMAHRDMAKRLSRRSCQGPQQRRGFYSTQDSYLPSAAVSLRTSPFQIVRLL